jgi:hypothetical protein
LPNAAKPWPIPPSRVAPAVRDLNESLGTTNKTIVVDNIMAQPTSQSPTDARERLGKLFGMLGSAHKGERAAALQAIDRAMTSSGASWADVATAIAAPTAQAEWRYMDDAPTDGRPVLLRLDNVLPGYGPRVVVGAILDEDKEGFANGVNNGLRERGRVFVLEEWLVIQHHRFS